MKYTFEYNSAAELKRNVEKSKLSLVEFICAREQEFFDFSETQVYERLSRYLATMRKSIEYGLKKKEKLICLDNEALKLFNAKIIIAGELELEIMYSALAVAEYNCSMGKIIACPTAGACGIVPGVLIPVSKKYNFSDEKIIDALIVSGEIGRIVANRTTISGAAGGCMVECGVAAAMAAAAVVRLFNGVIDEIFQAAALALKNNLGLTCDPVGGLVEAPCAKRNSFKALDALTAAQMALAGIKSVIPLDEVIDTVVETAQALPQKFKETSEGGLASTSTGIRYKKILASKKKR